MENLENGIKAKQKKRRTMHCVNRKTRIHTTTCNSTTTLIHTQTHYQSHPQAKLFMKQKKKTKRKKRKANISGARILTMVHIP